MHREIISVFVHIWYATCYVLPPSSRLLSLPCFFLRFCRLSFSEIWIYRGGEREVSACFVLLRLFHSWRPSTLMLGVNNSIFLLRILFCFL